MALSPILRGSYDPSYARSTSTGSLTGGLSVPTSSARASAAPQATPFGFDPGTNTLWVNGVTFNADDHDTALRSREALKQPMQPMPDNYRPMDIEEYGGYIDRIKNPSMGRLISKNIGIGVDQSQQLAGGVLKFLGAEDTGQKIIDQQTEDMRFNQPYQRNFTDIGSAGDAGEWFVANAAQMAPLMAEMIVTSVLTGGAADIVAAGTVGTGAAKLLARGSLRGATTDTAEAAARGLQMLRNGEKVARNSVEGQALREAGRLAGAKFGGMAASEGVALGDIYQSVEQSGNYDSPTLARLVTLFASIPYAASEYLPAEKALKTAFGRSGKAVLTKGAKAKQVAKKFGSGALVGAGIEGGTEVFQDMLTLGASGQLDLNDPAVRTQLINSFAAGAGVGAPIGGFAHGISRTEQAATAENTPPLDTSQPELNILNRNADGQGELFQSINMNGQGELFSPSEMRPAADRRSVSPMAIDNKDQLDLLNPVPPAVPQPSDRGFVPPPGVSNQQTDLFDPTRLEAIRQEDQATRGIVPVEPAQQPSGIPVAADYADQQQLPAPPEGTVTTDAYTPPPFNTALQDALQPVAEQQAAAERSRQIAEQQSQLRQEQFDQAQLSQQEQQFQLAQQAALEQQQAVAEQQMPQMELPFTGKVGQYGDLSRKAPAPQQIAQVREAVIKSQQRINALEALKQCLAGAR